MEYKNTTSSVEELHVFFSIGWFDLGSWAWVHHIVEWATKGVFMGERRFYLGAVVDDLFVATNEFLYDGEFNEGPVRTFDASGQEMLSTTVEHTTYRVPNASWRINRDILFCRYSLDAILKFTQTFDQPNEQTCYGYPGIPIHSCHVSFTYFSSVQNDGTKHVLSVSGAVGKHLACRDYLRLANLSPGAPPAGPGHQTSSSVACASVYKSQPCSVLNCRRIAAPQRTTTT